MAKYREVTQQEIAEMAAEMKAMEMKAMATREQWRAFIEAIYGDEAAFVFVQTESQYNDEGYDNVVGDIVVRDKNNRRIGPIPANWMKYSNERFEAGKRGFYQVHQSAIEDFDEEDAESEIRYAARFEIGIDLLGAFKLDLNATEQRKLYVREEGKSDVVTFVSADDWFGVYVNGELLDAAHNMRHVSFAEAFGAIGVEFVSKRVDQDWMESQATLPEKFDEIPPSAFER